MTQEFLACSDKARWPFVSMSPSICCDAEKAVESVLRGHQRETKPKEGHLHCVSLCLIAAQMQPLQSS